MKKIYKTFSIFFFLLLITMTLLTVFIPDKDYSETENRPLEGKPDFTLQNLADGTFQQDLGDYLSDQFPLREQMIKLNTLINKLSGGKNLGGAYLGKNGFYFEVVRDSDIDYERHEINLNAINVFAQKYPQINTNVLLVPTSSYVYSEYLPQGAEIYNADKLYDMTKGILKDEIFIDVRNSLIENKNEYLYYKTDHHWTSRGAYTAYSEFCKQKNIIPVSYEDFGFETVSSDFLGTLHSKNLDISASPDSVSIAKNINNCKVSADGAEIQIYDFDKLSVKDKYLIFFGSNYGETVIETECKNGKTLLVIKDSFANSFVPLLTSHYEKIIMIDQRYYETKSFAGIVEKHNVSDALFMYEITNLSIQTQLATACKN